MATIERKVSASEGSIVDEKVDSPVNEKVDLHDTPALAKADVGDVRSPSSCASTCKG